MLCTKSYAMSYNIICYVLYNMLCTIIIFDVLYNMQCNIVCYVLYNTLCTSQDVLCVWCRRVLSLLGEGGGVADRLVARFTMGVVSISFLLSLICD